MMSEGQLRDAAREAGLETPVRFDETTASTNATALELAAGGAPEWTLVAAGHQTTGRGRLGRAWVDRAGEALLFSLVLRAPLEPSRLGLLSLLAGARMAGACREVAGVGVGCKWPNDLLLDGRKVGGILAEGRTSGERLAHVVLGIGVNLGAPPEGVLGAGAVPGAESGRLLATFLRRFRETYRPEEAAFGASVLAAYRPLCLTLGRRVRATTDSGRAIEGLAVDLGEDGSLVVDVDGDRRTVAFGEVTHVEPG